MGMFDEVNFGYRMPDGFVSNGFQTKDFDCLMDIYTISREGRLIREHVFEEVDRPTGDMDFTGMLKVYDVPYFSGQRHEYHLEFVDGTLLAIHCNDDSGRMLYDPDQFIED